MKKVAICYWSGTGNTQAMAEAAAAGAREAGAEASLFTPEEFSGHKLDEFDAVAFGCPAMGAEELETEEFEPMFNGLSDQLSGKSIALFGSYGWGDGEWMDSWGDLCREKGAVLICDSVICQEYPDEEATASCRALGAALANV